MWERWGAHLSLRASFSASQRQQAKWLLHGSGHCLCCCTCMILLAAWCQDWERLTSLSTGQWHITTIMFLFVPLSVSMAIMRSRLWEIDLIIVACSCTEPCPCSWFWSMWVSRSSSEHCCGLSWVSRRFLGDCRLHAGVVALIEPLRHGIQRVIDRRFHRCKYKCEQDVEVFSATLRNELDLSQLREHLLAIRAGHDATRACSRGCAEPDPHHNSFLSGQQGSD